MLGVEYWFPWRKCVRPSTEPQTLFHINTIAWGFTLLMHFTFVLVHLEGMQKAMTDSH